MYRPFLYIETAASTVISLPTQVVVSHLPSLPSNFGGTFTSTTQSNYTKLYCILVLTPPPPDVHSPVSPPLWMPPAALSSSCWNHSIRYLFRPWEMWTLHLWLIKSCYVHGEVAINTRIFCCLSKPNFVDTRSIQDIIISNTCSCHTIRLTVLVPLSLS